MSPDAADRTPLDPDAVAQHAFSKARKGYDTDEVRAFLVGLATEIRDLQRVHGDLTRRLAEVERRAADPRDLDEESVTQLLGEETARVLVDARKAAAEIRSKADEAAVATRAAADADAAEARAAAEQYAESVRTLADEGETRIRADADAYSAMLRETADRETATQRAEADAYAEEVRSTADREVAEQRAAAQAEVDDLTKQARSVLDERTTEAETAAAGIRADADAYDARVRSEADAYVETTRSRADAYRDETRSEADRRRDETAAAAEQTRVEAAGAAAEVEAAAQERHDALIAAATAEAEQIVDDARDKGRSMVQEARDYRERVIVDLAERRRDARDELDRVGKTRDALAVTLTDVVTQVERSHRSLQDVAIDPGSVSDGGADRRFLEVDDDATSVAVGELEPSAEAAPTAEEPASPIGPDDADDGTDAPASPDPADGPIDEPDVPNVGDDPDADPSATDDAGGNDAPDAPLDDDAELDGDDDTPEGAVGDDDLDDEPPVWSDDDGADATSVDLEDDDETDVDSTSEDAETDDDPEHDVAEHGDADEPGTPPGIDDLFARIRAEREGEPRSDGDTADSAETDTDTADHAGAPDSERDEDDHHDEVEVEASASPDEDLLDRRDATTDELERQLARRLKRVLSDEQNEALHDLRSVKGSPSAEAVLPSVEDHRGRYRHAVLEDLESAERAGASFYGDAPPRTADVSDIADELAGDLVRQVRGRLERSFEDSDDPDDVADEIRTLYREWKTQRIAEAARHYVLIAFARGVAEAAPDGATFRWLVDHGGAAAPDCEDNALATAVAKGEPFPTGDLCPPVHPGCRCLTVPADLS